MIASSDAASPSRNNCSRSASARAHAKTSAATWSGLDVRGWVGPTCAGENPRNKMLSRELIESAAEAIRDHVRRTPLEHSPRLSELTRAEVFLKLDNQQVTGSFKARGAMHKLCRLAPDAAARGVICASSGNHGAAVAYGARKLGLTAVVCVPESACPSKLDIIRSHGAELRVVRTGFGNFAINSPLMRKFSTRRVYTSS